MQEGINLNNAILYHGASFRYFNKGEKHITRKFKKDVLLLVFEGVLRFTENGVKHEIHAGEYYIQKKGLKQSGDEASDSPKYLYIHFDGEWKVGNSVLPCFGSFEINKLFPVMERLDTLFHSDAEYIAQAAEFYKILTMLKTDKVVKTAAGEIAEYISSGYLSGVTLDSICQKYHFSKNHIINIFKKEYGVTPVAYINALKISRAEYLLVVTSDDIESIAYTVGFSNYTNFYRMFIRKNKMSPKEWRITKRL